MFHELLERPPRLRICHVVEQSHRPVEFGLTGWQARDGKVDGTKRVLPVVVHLTMEDVRSDEEQNNPKHDS
jgi:hypothetical protein